jgi:hypothetical protein
MVASSKSLKKLGISKAAQNQEDFAFNTGGFSYLNEIIPIFFSFFWDTESSILKSLQLYQVEVSKI